MKTLDYLLAPFSTSQFLAEYWTKKALYFQGQPQKFSPLFSWSALNYLLNYHRLSESDIRFSLNGQTLPDSQDPRIWQERLNQGATLVVNGLHHRIPALAALAADLRQELGYRTHINLYCSPPQQQGFACHYDTHEVFVLQIDGTKAWSVYPATVPFPDRSRSQEQDSAQEIPQEAYLNCVLHPGDVLYIPKGHWHCAVACDRPSLHLTVGVDCLTGLDWLDWLRQDLQSLPEWRQSLPAIANGSTDDLKQHLIALQERLTAVLADPEQLQRCLDDFANHDQPPLPISLPTQLGVDIFRDGFTTQFTWPLLHERQVKQVDEAHYEVQVGPKQIELRGISPAFAEKLVDSHQFKLVDAACWEPALDLETDVAPLLASLVQQGVLLVEH